MISSRVLQFLYDPLLFLLVLLLLLLLLCHMFHGRCGDAGSLNPVISWQQATSDFKDSSEDPC